MTFKMIALALWFGIISLSAESNVEIIVDENGSIYVPQNIYIQSGINDNNISTITTTTIVEDKNASTKQQVAIPKVKDDDNEVCRANKITLLYIDSPDCPYCRELDKLFLKPEPAKLLEKYFIIKREKLDDNLELPKGAPKPYGTPTVYFLNSKDEMLSPPMRGRKTEEELLEFFYEAINDKERIVEKKEKKERKSENLWEKALSE